VAEVAKIAAEEPVAATEAVTEVNGFVVVDAVPSEAVDDTGAGETPSSTVTTKEVVSSVDGSAAEIVVECDGKSSN